MKKLLSIFLLCFCFSVSAQYENGVIDIEDFDFVPPITDNNESLVFPAGTLSDFVGGLFQVYVNGNPVTMLRFLKMVLLVLLLLEPIAR